MVGSLSWGIKSSLLAYISTLEDGSIETFHPASKHDSGFKFELDESDSSFDIASSFGHLQFRGRVLLSGYFGAMRIEIKDPRLTINGSHGELALRFDSYKGTTTYEAVASGEYDPNTSTCQLNLTYTGQMLLGQQYQVGQSIDSAQVALNK